MQINEFKLNILSLSKKLLRFAGHILKNDEEAQDAVQDTFLKLWQKKDQLCKIKNLDAFAMRMVRNRCLDMIRGKRVSINGEEDKIWLNNSLVMDHDQVELADTAKKIKLLIGGLPEQQQTVIHLRDIENYEYDEIAEITGLNTNSIRVNLSRARRKVRDELLNEWQNETERNRNIAGKIF